MTPILCKQTLIVNENEFKANSNKNIKTSRNIGDGQGLRYVKTNKKLKQYQTQSKSICIIIKLERFR